MMGNILPGFRRTRHSTGGAGLLADDASLPAVTPVTSKKHH